MCVSAASATAAVQPGLYDGGQSELAAALELQPGGRFRYALTYGALDERAEGRWAERDGAVLLTTEPAPKPPRFPVISDSAAPDGKLYVSMQNPEALGGFSLTLRVRYAGSEAFDFLEADEDGAVPLAPGKTIVELVPALPIYDQVAQPYRLSPGGHRIVFGFEPNDLFVAAFSGEQVIIEGKELVLRRHDRVIRFRKTD